MASKRVKISYRKSAGKWIQNTRGIPAAEGIYNTKKQAVKEGRALAKRHGAKLVVARKDGTIQKRHDYTDSSSGRGRSGGGGILGGDSFF